MAVAIEKQRGLVNPVDDAIPWYAVHASADPRNGREQVGYMEDVVRNRARFDHLRPAHEGIDAVTSLRRVTLAAAIDHRRIARLWRVLCKVTVVAHHDHNRVV